MKKSIVTALILLGAAPTASMSQGLFCREDAGVGLEVSGGEWFGQTYESETFVLKYLPRGANGVESCYARADKAVSARAAAGGDETVEAACYSTVGLLDDDLPLACSLWREDGDFRRMQCNGETDITVGREGNFIWSAIIAAHFKNVSDDLIGPVFIRVGDCTPI